MKTAALLFNGEKEHMAGFAQTVAETLAGFGISAAPLDSCTNNPDIVVTVGGDGTLLRGGKLAAKLGVPVLGVNAGNVGFLTELEMSELRLLEKLREDAYNTDRHALLEVLLRAEGQTTPVAAALNDVVLSRGSRAQVVMFDVSADGCELGSFTADGLVAATPLGSTADSLSAGGPVVHPDCRCIVLTPVCAVGRVRPFVLPEGTRVSVSARKLRERPVYLSADGEDILALEPGSSVEIVDSGVSAAFCRLKDRALFGKLL
jgi:NAD+ kinase